MLKISFLLFLISNLSQVVFMVECDYYLNPVADKSMGKHTCAEKCCLNVAKSADTSCCQFTFFETNYGLAVIIGSACVGVTAIIAIMVTCIVVIVKKKHTNKNKRIFVRPSPLVAPHRQHRTRTVNDTQEHWENDVDLDVQRRIRSQNPTYPVQAVHDGRVIYPILPGPVRY